MTDNYSLRIHIANSGLKFAYIAEKLGISCNTLRTRLNGSSEFSADEIRVLKDVLRLTDEDIIKIFFETKVD